MRSNGLAILFDQFPDDVDFCLGCGGKVTIESVICNGRPAERIICVDDCGHLVAAITERVRARERGGMQ